MTPTQLFANPRERKEGRPPANPDAPRFWETDLHKLLVVHLGHIEGLVVGGRVVPNVLAKSVGCCRFTAYRWLGENKLSARGARKIIELSEGRVTKEDCAPFLIL
jgi:hypothetical protein